ncbi:hypothetical protein [Spirosoma rhododendri]|nr:hypothetical protein [Spirosoma rhododendri]
MKIWRIAALALVAGLALFLITVLLKMLIIAVAVGLLVRVVGFRLASQVFGRVERGGWQMNQPIAIDSPVYRTPARQMAYDRVIQIG